MPGNALNAAPVTVLPLSLGQSFVHERAYPPIENEYKNGESQRSVMATNSRPRWRHPGGSAPISEDVTAEDMIAGLRQLVELAHERGLKIFGGTIMPFTTPGSPKDLKRQAVNQWIVNGKAFDGVIDFDKLVRDPAQPSRILALYDSGDGLHPNDAGLKAMGEAVDLSLFSR